jgi:WS/DGAT/MGAT family acyltransferase
MGTPIPMLDLMFFLTESAQNPRHVGALLIFERPPRRGADIVEQVVRAYRRAVPVSPFNRVANLLRPGLPEWQEVESFDRNWHVQHLMLPPPGTDAHLHEFVAALHEPVLDRDRPGWRIFVIEGLERDRFAVFIKVHHSLVDGESGMALLQRSLSRSPGDRRIRSIVSTRLPVPKAALPQGPLRRFEHDIAAAGRQAVWFGRGALRLAEETAAGLRGYARDRIRPFTAPLTPMNDPIRSERAITHLTIPLDSMKAIARGWGATLNDVALCVLDAGLQRFLRELKRPPARPLVAICPVSLQDRELKEAATRVSIFWTPLGMPRATLARRMDQVIANTREAKQRIRSLPRDVAYAYAVLTFALGETLALVPRRTEDYLLPANVLISNVRGPETPLYLGGARLEALCPVSTLISGMGLNITFMSYAGQVLIGYTANAMALPDVARLGRFTRDAFAALERQTRRGVRPRAP